VSEIDFTPFLVIAFLIGLVIFTVRQVKAYGQNPDIPRTDQRIPADELRRLGDDWRDPVRPYFQRRWESAVRTRAAVNHVCGISDEGPNE
jgi:hypothetical protein